MGKYKKYVIISGLNFNDNNRGTAALSYGSISFMKEKGYLSEGQELINFRQYKNFFKKKNLKGIRTEIQVSGDVWKHTEIAVFFLEYLLLIKFGILIPFTRFGQAIKNTSLVAAINGGDGFSDIYNTRLFFLRLKDSQIAMKRNIPVILLPQTIGPFNEAANRKIADLILKYASKVYVRDDCFINELRELGIDYEETKDLSFYMQPEPWNIDIKENPIGVNVSGLAYSNNFRSLKGQFNNYPELIDRLICTFRDKGHTVYLIPHSYNYQNPESDNDDMIACRQAYEKLKDKSAVYVVDKNLTSPQVKYLISKMSFFIGTRMHANFAAIYTGVPVFGLAYSYKFKGAFDANGLDGEKQTVMINNLPNNEIKHMIDKICLFYNI